MIIRYQCITDEPHSHKYNVLYLCDKIADKVLHVHELLPFDINGNLEIKQVPKSEIDKLINDTNLKILDRTTNKDINNLEAILVCDIFEKTDDRYSEDYCLVNGILTKRYDIVLSTNTTDTDGDGIVDIDGDGISEARINIHIIDIDTKQPVNNFSGLVEVKTERGKIIGDNGRFVNIINGLGSFKLRSAPETVSNNKVRARLMGDNTTPIDRAHMSEPLKINFR